MSESNELNCPCGSNELLTECCGPILDGTKFAKNPEAVMRARYSAYAIHKTDYLGKSLHPSNRDDFDPKAVEKWSHEAQWLGLEIINTTEKNNKGYVEFKSKFKQDGVIRTHHEDAEFRKVDGQWYFWDGKLVTNKPIKNDGPKIGRNDPCPCGSGKKYKKCCAKNS